MLCRINVGTLGVIKHRPFVALYTKRSADLLKIATGETCKPRGQGDHIVRSGHALWFPIVHPLPGGH